MRFTPPSYGFPGHDRRAPWAAGGLILGFVVLHLMAAGRVNLGVDEAHYALYGLYPDWSYFDHPPLIGWLQAVAIRLFGTSDLALRIIPIMLVATANGLIFPLTRRLFPEASPWSAFLAVLLAESAPILQLIGLGMVPDTALLLVGVLSMLTLHEAINRPSALRWLSLGVLLGLAGLTKYTAVTLALSTLILIFWNGRQRELLRWPIWAAVGIAAVELLPVLYWNATHDWLSFKYQFKHGTGDFGWEAKRFGMAQAAQLVLYNPVVWITGLLVLARGLTRDSRHPGMRTTVAVALPILLLFGWTGGYTTTLPHWTSLAWFVLTPAVAVLLLKGWQSRWVRGLTLFSSALTMALVLAFHVEATFRVIPFPAEKHPLQDMIGWPEAARHAIDLQKKLGNATLDGTKALPPLKIFTPHWVMGSRLQWYALPEKVVLADTRFDQFDLWNGRPAAGDRGIMVTWSRSNARLETGGANQFARCEPIDSLDIRQRARSGESSDSGTLISRFNFHLCTGWRDN